MFCHTIQIGSGIPLTFSHIAYTAFGLCETSNWLRRQLENSMLNTLGLQQNGRYFGNVIFPCIFLGETVCVCIHISLSVVPSAQLSISQQQLRLCLGILQVSHYLCWRTYLMHYGPHKIAVKNLLACGIKGMQPSYNVFASFNLKYTKFPTGGLKELNNLVTFCKNCQAGNVQNTSIQHWELLALLIMSLCIDMNILRRK